MIELKKACRVTNAFTSILTENEKASQGQDVICKPLVDAPLEA